MKKKNNVLTGLRIPLHLLQQLCMFCAVALFAVAILGSFVTVTNSKGTEETLFFKVWDQQDEFEDTSVFQELYGKNITDLICYVAIRSQMETNGKFDENKPIDITAFYNRYYGISGDYLTAEYRLGDLIKWAQYGFEPTQSGHTPLSVSGNDLDDQDDLSDPEREILKNRYKSIDGKNLEEQVSTWEEYEILREILEKVSHDLLINYNLYLTYQSYFDGNDSSLAYVILNKQGRKTFTYSNLKKTFRDKIDVDALKKEYPDTYVYYDSSAMEYNSANSKIKEETIRYVLKGYEYAYPEDTELFIAVKHPYGSDAFGQAAKAFDRHVPHMMEYLIAAVLLGIIYFLLLILLTILEGKKWDAEEAKWRIALKREDRIPTEVMALLGVGIAVVMILLFLYVIDSYSFFYDLMGGEFFAIFLALLALLCSLCFGFFYYSLVRRIKAKTLWKNSLTRRMMKASVKGASYVYENGTLVLRSLVPGVVIVFVNLLLAVTATQSDAVFAMNLIVALVLDFGALFLCYKSASDRTRILDGIREINAGNRDFKIDMKGLYGDNQVLATEVNGIGDSISHAVETSMKDEKLKADLITNVSHDIKTPLTSIINYVDLIKRENVENEKVREYIAILDAKSQRLKQLTDDLVEASKISSGNIVLQLEKINLGELVSQSIGEFSDKFEKRGLKPVVRGGDASLCVKADSRRIWRVMENLFNNIFKYAMQGTRVYIDIERVVDDETGLGHIVLSVKNISANPIAVSAEELTERFIRGDESRTTEGSGLGLSIAKNLTNAMNGEFAIQVDGDLFKVILAFPEFQ